MEILDDINVPAVLSGERRVVIDVWAPWCGPCLKMSPILEEIAEDYDGIFDFYKLNADTNPITLEVFDIKSIPTILIFDYKGNEVDRLVGSHSKTAIDDHLTNVLDA